jgi:hypothetical protein
MFARWSIDFAHDLSQDKGTILFCLNIWKTLKLVVCILLRVLGQVQGFRLTQHWFKYVIQ